MARTLLVWMMVLWLAAAATAQENGATIPRWSQELGVWGAYSPNSTIGIGQTRNRSLFELNAQYAWTFWTPKKLALKYVGEATPLALLTEPGEFYFNSPHQLTGYRAGATTYGGGFTPLGLQLNMLNGHRVQPYVDAHGGLLYFTRQEPVPNSSQFNFTFNFGAGVQLLLARRSSLLLGYKYHHISNNETAPQNPGIDNSEAYAGWLWRWK